MLQAAWRLPHDLLASCCHWPHPQEMHQSHLRLCCTALPCSAWPAHSGFGLDLLRSLWKTQQQQQQQQLCQLLEQLLCAKRLVTLSTCHMAEWIRDNQDVLMTVHYSLCCKAFAVTHVQGVRIYSWT